jgi:transposase InsO family protein
VRLDRICTDNGIKHLLTAPRSPTTTGKVERWHKTLRREFLDGKVFASATPSRSPSATSSSAPTPCVTTAPASTALSPTPAADPTASTPPDGFDLSASYRGRTVTRVPGLEIAGMSPAWRTVLAVAVPPMVIELWP